MFFSKKKAPVDEPKEVEVDPAPVAPEPEEFDAPSAAPSAESAPAPAPANGAAGKVSPTTVYGEVMALMARDAQFAGARLGDLDKIVTSALITRQVIVVRAKKTNTNEPARPVGAAVWARVSPEVDQRLEAAKAAGQPVELTTEDWTSGDIPWVMAMTGAKVSKNAMVERLQKDLFQGQAWKSFFAIET